jgi:predicted GNAT family acetyltransferase
MHVLDCPIWNSLNSVHASLAEGDGLARRYRADIGPLAGMRDQSPGAYRALGALLGPTDVAVLFLDAPPSAPDGWRLVGGAPMAQMVCDSAIRKNTHHSLQNLGDGILSLGTDDVPAMRALAELTEPGPFRERTIEFGGFVGIRDGGRLVAMAGQRLALDGFTEVSAVCTHPDYRGRGYAGALVATVARGIFARGQVPFLGVRLDNVGAMRVYERLGFVTRRTLQIAAYMRPSLPD